MNPTPDGVRAVLRERVLEPELGANIVDLGLVYDVQVVDSCVSVDMALINPDRSYAGELAGQVEAVLREVFEGLEVEVSLVCEPPWTPDMMDTALRRQWEER